MGLVNSAGVFLITSISGFVLFALLLRLFMELSVVRVVHPVFNAIQSLTTPMVGFFKRSVFSAGRTSTVVIALIVSIELLKCTLIYLLSYGITPSLFTLLVFALFELASLLVNLCFYSILAHVVMSWVPSLQHSPITSVVRMLVTPVLRPFYKYISLGNTGIDIVPMVAILSLQMIERFLLAPLALQFL